MTANELRLYQRLQLAAHFMRKAADQRLIAQAELTAAQAGVLAVIASGEPSITQRDVARTLGLNESAMTAMTARLMRAGLVDREQSDADARAWRLFLTEPGRAAGQKAKAAFTGINQRIEDELSEEEMMRFVGTLDRLIDRFVQE